MHWYIVFQNNFQAGTQIESTLTKNEIMKASIFTSEFSIYKLNTEENQYIAVPQAFARIIRQYILEYHSLHSVPSYKKVKGIMFRDLNSYNQNVETSQQIKDIPINQLVFDSSDSLC